MAATAPDEMIVDMLLNETGLTDLIGNRVFHLEVYQKNTANRTNYPVVVYQKADDDFETELNGVNGYVTAIYNVVCITKSSAELRTMANTIRMFNSEVKNEDFAEDYDNFVWIEVMNDSESLEFTMEQDEKGFKTAQLLIKLTYVEEFPCPLA